MADFTANTPGSNNPILRALNAVFDRLIAISEDTKRARRAEALLSLNDDQLAARDLKRSDITPFVFRDAFTV